MTSEEVTDFFAYLKKCKGMEIELRLIKKYTKIANTLVSGKVDVYPIVRELESNNKLLATEKTINFIHNIDSDDKTKYSLIETRIYKDSDKPAEIKFGTKKKLFNFYITQTSENYGFRGAVSEEIPMSADEVKTKFSGKSASNSDSIRLKKRNKYKLGPWYLDITFVIDATGKNPEFIKNSKAKLFESQNYESDVEIELEHSDPESIKIADFEYIRFDPEVGKSAGNPFSRLMQLVTNRSIPFSPENFKRISNSVIELSKLSYIDVYKNNPEMVVTDKMDGERTLLFLEEEQINIITSKNIVEIKIKPQKKILICDCEMLITDEELKKLYIFDMIYSNKLINKSDNKTDNKTVYEMNMEDRILLISESVEIIKKIIEDNKIGEFKIRSKEYLLIGRPQKMGEDDRKKIFDFYNKKRKYETDGLILSELGQNYRKTKNYKWKPIDKLSIDFLILKCPAELLGKIPYVSKPEKTLYLLLSHYSIKSAKTLKIYPDDDKFYKNLIKQPNLDSGFCRVLFMPSMNKFAHIFYSSKSDLDGKVGEFVLIDQAKWKLMRIRKDKDRGNAFNFAESIYWSYFDPLKLHDLVKPDFGYFESQETDDYKAARNYNSFVKEQILNEIGTFNNVVDFCSGRGQDFFRYANRKVKTLLLIENDKLAIAEIISRKHQYAKSETGNRIEVIIVCADLLKPYKDTLDLIKESGYTVPGFDLAVCNFAFHYMSKTVKSMTNFFNLINSVLSTGGFYTMTVFDADRIDKKITGKWQIENTDGSIKYKIKKKYKELGVGSEIKVKLPFSRSSYMEPLVNRETVFKLFKKYKILIDLNFAGFSKKYKYWDQMKPEDREFVDFYQAYLFKKSS